MNNQIEQIMSPGDIENRINEMRNEE